jgi:hypothetical protein
VGDISADGFQRYDFGGFGLGFFMSGYKVMMDEHV